MNARYRSGTRDVHVGIEKRDGERLEVRAGERHFALGVRAIDGATLVLETADGVCTAHVVRRGDSVQVHLRGAVYHFDSAAEDDVAVAHGMQAPRVTAPMPGKVLRVLVRAGQAVARGDGLVILEAMKMENRIVAEGEATIVRVAVAEGQTVEAGALLVELAPAP